MDLFTYLLGKKGQNTHKDLFSYLLGKNGGGGSGTYTTFSGTSLNIASTLRAKIKNFMLNSTELTQDGTPTPDTPVDVNVIKGENNIKITDGIEEQNYPISLGSLEYCKIGDYADQIFKNTTNSPYYDSTLLENEWYLKKNIGKAVWNGTENWVLAWNNTERQLMRLYYRAIINAATSANRSYSNYLPRAKSYADIENGATAKMCFLLEASNYNNVVIPTTNFTDVNAWKDWLSTHNTKVYYSLATPQYIHISETDYPILRSQLENIYNNAKSYNGQTNITQTNEDLPFNISVDVKVANL